ncbi:hypothetical protein IU453_02555 [Nocardia cyriacigeorgica]|uniref:hypothetical protein n=1 Tax=Nocardia cyriacigeorgica TaxID=135487 RepID=UPI001894084B|nr:hypothetical protein [Nocardia cyriacigeorgica]MBF6315660.1 hypothetical protein [Nocardia cyriacigeorgica]MBF6530445.1 hypothetical protein [Nocardia cyriacigeorgica]
MRRCHSQPVLQADECRALPVGYAGFADQDVEQEGAVAHLPRQHGVQRRRAGDELEQPGDLSVRFAGRGARLRPVEPVEGEGEELLAVDERGDGVVFDRSHGA